MSGFTRILVLFVVIALGACNPATSARGRSDSVSATLEFRAITGDEAAAAEALQSGQIPPDSDVLYQSDGQPLLLSRQVVVSGDQLLSATQRPDPLTGLPIVSITLDQAGGQRMFEHTRQNVGNRLGVVYIGRIPTVTVVDGGEVRSWRVEERVITASIIRSVFGKEFQVAGLSPDEARDLARQLKSGSLPTGKALREQSE